MTTFHRLSAVVLWLAVLASAASAAPIPGAANVRDESYTDSAGRRLLQESVDVAASKSEVWAALTTDKGLTSWAVKFARIDLRVGGIMETSYRPDAKPGDQANIKNVITAFAPERMLATRNVQAPPGTPFDAATFQSIEDVILIDPLPGGRSRVTELEPDYLANEKYDRVYRFFRIGNGVSLQALHDRYARK
jgi:uncharacterized protein YndB with AHSA1/START domain